MDTPQHLGNRAGNRAGNRTALVLQIVLLGLMMALSALIGLIWFGGEQLLFPPTPTATATAGRQLSPTVDFRSTMIAEDLATQVAYSTLAAQLGLSPLVAPTPSFATAVAVNLPIVNDGEVVPDTTAEAATDNGTGNPPTSSEGNTNISLPVVVNNSSMLASPTSTPLVVSELPIETPTETPTETPISLPTETPVTQLPADIPTPTPFFVESLQAVAATPSIVLRTGPNNLNATSNTVAGDSILTLSGRDETGEWVYLCCNPLAWVRQIYVTPRDNPLPAGAPAGANANDVRWLRVQAPPPTTLPILTPTAIPANSYPLARRDRSNSGRVPQLPTWPLMDAWPNPFRAEQPMISPIVVANDKVIVASADKRIYALGLLDGNYLWQFEVGAFVNFSPAVQDSSLYFTDDQSRVFAVQDAGSQAQQLWQRAITGVPKSDMYVAGDRLYVITSVSPTQDYIITLNRFTGDPIHNPYVSSGLIAPMLTFGNQLLYMGDPMLRALDVNDFSVIWTRDDIRNLTAPAVFMLNGPNALAELYVADNRPESGSRLHAINANTGQNIWTTIVGREITGIAVDETAVYVTGEGFIRAIPRQAGNASLWEIGINGRALGGPLIDNDQILIVTTTGLIQSINFSGQIIGNITIRNGQLIVGEPAVSGQYLYIPVNDSIVYTYRGQAQ